MRFALAIAIIGLSASSLRADDWPHWLGPTRDGYYRETGTLTKFKNGEAKVVWRTPIAGGYSGPAVAGDKVFVTDYLSKGANTPPQPDVRDKLTGVERVLALDVKTGKVLWKHEYNCAYQISYPAGPRATPAVDDGLVYAEGAEGRLTVLEADTGKLVWSKELKTEYKFETPLWGCCSHPLIVGDVLYMVVGGEGSVVVAFDKKTGKELWKSLSAKEPGYSAPKMIQMGGANQLIVWHADAINSLDPQTGKLHWSYELAPNYGMSIMQPIVQGNLLFAGGYGKAACLELASNNASMKEIWKGGTKVGLSAVCSPPIAVDGVIYGADQPGQFRAFDLKTGKRLWETTKPTTGGRPAGSAAGFVVKGEQAFFIFTETGDLITANLSTKGYDEISRANILEPTGQAFGRQVVWSHPAFAQRCCFARNDKEIVCVSLAAEDGAP